MATAATYPKISRKLWWLLRDRFKKTVPTVVTPTLVTSLAPMADGSARSNVINPLRELGLLDDDNKPTEWATRWRHDDEYAAVCQEIRQMVYPPELIEAFPDADSGQKEQIKTWFMKVGHVGDAAARMYTDTYLLLSEADPTKRDERVITNSAAKSTAPRPKTSAGAQVKRASTSAQPAQTSEAQTHQGSDMSASTAHRRGPAIHIDVQVHISPHICRTD